MASLRLSPDTFAAFYLEIHPALTTEARRRGCYDPYRAVDDAQDHALFSLAQFDAAGGIGAFTKWMFRILDYRIRDEVRRQNRESEILADYAEQCQVDEAALFEDAALRHDLRFRIRITPLDDDERYCILAQLDGYTQRQIALRLGVSAATVNRLVKSARQKLQDPARDGFSSADLDRYRWRGDAPPAYRRPLTTGAGLSRERLQKLK